MGRSEPPQSSPAGPNKGCPDRPSYLTVVQSSSRPLDEGAATMALPLRSSVIETLLMESTEGGRVCGPHRRPPFWPLSFTVAQAYSIDGRINPARKTSPDSSRARASGNPYFVAKTAGPQRSSPVRPEYFIVPH